MRRATMLRGGEEKRSSISETLLFRREKPRRVIYSTLVARRLHEPSPYPRTNICTTVTYPMDEDTKKYA